MISTGRVAHALTQEDIRRLSVWKQRYALEAAGFTRSEAYRLIVLRMWRRRGMVMS